MTELKETLIRIEGKVEIHNNYDKRIRSLEVNQWKITGLYTGILAIMGIIYFLLH
jgi:hypothetical protein